MLKNFKSTRYYYKLASITFILAILSFIYMLDCLMSDVPHIAEVLIAFALTIVLVRLHLKFIMLGKLATEYDSYIDRYGMSEQGTEEEFEIIKEFGNWQTKNRDKLKKYSL